MAKKPLSEIERGAGLFAGLVGGLMDLAREKSVPVREVLDQARADARRQLHG